jgi:hypothetical protein
MKNIKISRILYFYLLFNRVSVLVINTTLLKSFLWNITCLLDIFMHLATKYIFYINNVSYFYKNLEYTMKTNEQINSIDRLHTANKYKSNISLKEV